MGLRDSKKVGISCKVPRRIIFGGTSEGPRFLEKKIFTPARNAKVTLNCPKP